MKPTERTLKLLRDDGWTCDMIERWIRNPKHPAGGFRKDYLGFGDILAFRGPEVAIVQSCGSAYAQHLKTILSIPQAADWARWHKLYLIAWRKVKYKRGGKLKIWKPRIAHFHVIDDILVHVEQKAE